jgi:hypothetical protein
MFLGVTVTSYISTVHMRTSGNLRNACKCSEEPRLRILQSLDELVMLEMLVLDASLIASEAADGDDALFLGQEPSVEWRVRENEPNESLAAFIGCAVSNLPIHHRSHQSEHAHDDHEPLPRHEVLGMSVQDAIADKAHQNNCYTIHEDCRSFLVFVMSSSKVVSYTSIRLVVSALPECRTCL